MVRRALCVATVALVFMLALVGFGLQQPGTASQTAVGTGSDGSVVSYQVQTVAWPKLAPRVKNHWWGQEVIFNKDQTKMAAASWGGGILWAANVPLAALAVPTIVVWADSAADMNNCLILTRTWGYPMLWAPRSYRC